MAETTTYKNVTLYTRNSMMGNISAIECREVRVTVRPYAQYSHAVHVEFVKKGARKFRGFVQSYRPSLVIVDGYKALKPAGLFERGKKTTFEGGSMEQAQYAGCSEEWGNDFATDLDKWAAETGREIVADFRNHNSHRG